MKTSTSVVMAFPVERNGHRGSCRAIALWICIGTLAIAADIAVSEDGDRVGAP